jgi:hypothetical protein
VVASGCKWLLAQAAASSCFFENHNDARLHALCNVENKVNSTKALFSG